MPDIDAFAGRYRFLSNFWFVTVSYDGVEYPSVEHAFQAAKTIDPEERKPILAMTAGQAKKYGRTVTLRADWEAVKIDVMHALLRRKFDPEVHPELTAKLVATHPNDLIEGNTWNDTFWGICRGVGENHLGRLLMAVRAEFVARVGTSHGEDTTDNRVR